MCIRDRSLTGYGHYSYDFKPEATYYTESIQDYYRRQSAPKIAVLLESDFWNFTEKQIQKLEEYGGVYAGWGNEFVPCKEEITDQTKGEYPSTLTDNWFDFIIQKREKVFSFLHYVTDEELTFIPLESRPNNWSILGASYASRKTAREHLSLANIKWEGRSQMLMMKLLSRTMQYGLIPKSWAIKKMNKTFSQYLRDCKYGYTCGAFIRGPIRKFFEIPASSQVLVCQPFKGASSAGFIDQINMIASDPGDIIEIDDWLRRHPDDAQQIASKGYRLIETCHSIDARANQLKMIFKRMIENKFSGCTWKDGHLAPL